MKRYGRGLYSTRKTKTRQVSGSEFDGFVTGEGVVAVNLFSYYW
jgi:hypothetical protein